MKKISKKAAPPEIFIYVEGGGPTPEGRAQLRQGFDELLKAQKQKARERRFHWKLVLCGPRGKAHEAFHNALKSKTDAIVALLVDSEGPVNGLDAASRVAHLTQCDKWDFQDAPAEHVHLMVQAMEAWILADTDALKAFYGQHFHESGLPKRPNLDEEPKDHLKSCLKRASKDTTKGEYEEIGHGSKLLAKLNASVVGARCPSFGVFTQWLDQVIEETK